VHAAAEPHLQVAGCPLRRAVTVRSAAAGGRMLVCPICLDGRKLDKADLIEPAEIGRATPFWEWIGDGATVFSY
jgi:hypothetical protein